MKDKLRLGTFMRTNKMMLLIFLVIIIGNLLINGIAWGVSGGFQNNIGDIANTTIGITASVVPVYIILTAIFNVTISARKCILLSTPRKIIYNSILVNDFINMSGAAILAFGMISLINKGLSYEIIMSNVKTIGIFVVLGVLASNLIEYICLIFQAYGVYYGLSNIFIFFGVAFYFIRDMYFIFMSGISGITICTIVLAIILLLYVNYLLINKLEVRG